ncbi:hypothetical protein F4V57_03320 [Acinetobacter qingfengensis]|uniref:Uncharacterized protein n=1 Tax=Acinetobacter qingfengensis TaxID=1262585 RepID=A0A1E7RAU9_9GAMM|nr:hypothetical protein [Acinetobacter qingfengensis]KAA8734804.1 hypothetical protein F4V57_03320 [Acinetobacter qingfengensis]OEY96431.1 hypothetical protein BJI46_12080 [Acinetobacter qingfengensis]
MLHIFLKDSQKNIEFHDYPGEDPIKFMMNFKKIFPSTFDLLLPVLPEDESQLDQVTWESDRHALELFKRLIKEWAIVEIRLSALTKFKQQDDANKLVKQAQQIRKNFQHKQIRLNLLEADYVFLLATHSLLDAELVELGTPFYLPTLKQSWQADIPKSVLNMTI